MDFFNEENKSDEDVIGLVLKDQKFFIILVDRYKDRLFRYISRISNFDEQEKEDLLQEIFIKAYLNLNSFKRDLKFSSWIYRIARNETINHFRKTKRRPQALRISEEDNIVERLKSDFDIEKEANRNINSENLLNALNGVKLKYREVLILKFIEEKDYKEISDILKLPMGTIATYINRGKKELKVKIKKYDE